MKQLIVLAIFVLGSFAAKAQFIRNLTGCPVEVSIFCYDPATCASMPPCTVLSLPAGAVVPLPSCACMPPMTDEGFIVRFNTCPTPSVTVGNPPCFPPALPVPGCQHCVGNAMWNGVDLDIN
jgi:hypothetical protein